MEIWNMASQYNEKGNSTQEKGPEKLFSHIE